MKAPRGKRLTFLIASAAIAVLLGAALASRDLILTAWYAQRLQSDDVGEQLAAIKSLSHLRSSRAADVPVNFLVSGRCRFPVETPLAVADMGEMALEPLAEAFRVATPDPQVNKIRSVQDYPFVDTILAIILEIQRDEADTKSLLKNIGWSLRPKDEPLFPKRLTWLSRVQPIEGKPCRVFLFDPTWASWPGLQPQTILITDAESRVITWKEVGGEPIFRSCELEIVDGAAYFVVTCDERHSRTPGKYTYRLTLRGIEEQK